MPTRAFHWLLVLLVAVNVFTGFVTPEWWLGVHNWVGYGLVALMLFRLVWGICGSEYSRVTSFIYPPRDTFEHLRGLLLLRPPHYVGHNPTGALMVFALAGVLIALVVTGLLVLGGEEKQGPLAAVIGYSVASAAKQIHHWLTLLLLVMISGHIAGVVTESLLTHDNLVRAIITGWKQLPPAAPVPTPRAARPVLAVALFVVVAGGAVATLDWFSRRPPPLSLRALPENATYTEGMRRVSLRPQSQPAPGVVVGGAHDQPPRALRRRREPRWPHDHSPRGLARQQRRRDVRHGIGESIPHGGAGGPVSGDCHPLLGPQARQRCPGGIRAEDVSGAK